MDKFLAGYCTSCKDQQLEPVGHLTRWIGGLLAEGYGSDSGYDHVSYADMVCYHSLTLAFVSRSEYIDTIRLNGNSKELSSSRLDDRQCAALASGLRGTSFLRVLDLSMNEVSDAGALALATYLKVPRKWCHDVAMM